MAPQREPFDVPDHVKLFLGALVQWALGTAFTRYAVAGGYGEMFVTVFLGQSLWWVNIQQTTRDGGWTRWLTWVVGAGLGAILGKFLS